MGGRQRRQAGRPGWGKPKAGYVLAHGLQREHEERDAYMK
jgi:hypothetical protein